MTDLISNSSFHNSSKLAVETTSKVVIHAPAESVDLPQWLFTLTDREYQQCSTAHIAGGTTRTSEGKRVSINVEEVGPGLIVQHWTEDIADKDHLRVVSLSDMFVQQNRVKVQLSWDMLLKPLSADSCELTNHISIFETADFLTFVEKSGVPLEQMKDAIKSAIDAHNAEETPNFARNIETKAIRP